MSFFLHSFSLYQTNKNSTITIFQVSKFCNQISPFPNLKKSKQKKINLNSISDDMVFCLNLKNQEYKKKFFTRECFSVAFCILVIIVAASTPIPGITWISSIPPPRGGIRACHRDGQCHQNKKQQHAQEVHSAGNWWYWVKP